MNPVNPWTTRFESLLDPQEIRRLALQTPAVLTDLDRSLVEVACKRIENAFKELFIPTEQTVAVLGELVGMALAHSQVTYPDARAFRAGIYASKVPLPDMSVVACLVGLAGVGKSHLLKVLRRILGAKGKVLVGSDHSAFPLVPGWFHEVREQTSISKMLSVLVGDDDPEAEEVAEINGLANELSESAIKPFPKRQKDISRRLARCRGLAFRNGVSLVIADEFQFATRSEQANALVTSMLLHLAAIGVPVVFVANYSLGHRLRRRPQEDVQRLLSRPLVLMPDGATSADWLETVRGYREVAPDVFVFEPEAVAEVLHGWTAGLKRLLGRLLVLAYRRARQTGRYVGFAELEWAYRSIAFSADREDVNLIHQQCINTEVATKRKDLVCPFELPAAAVIGTTESSRAQRLSEMNEEVLKSAMTPEERKTYEELKRAARMSTPSTKGKAVDLKKRSTSAEDLRRGEEIFQALAGKKDRL